MADGVSRRRALLGIGLAASTAAPASAERSPPSDPATIVGLFADLGRLAVPDGVDLIQTSGAIGVGVGAARYVAAEPSAPELSETRWRTRTANGRWFELAEDRITPEMFARRGDPDDTDACQAWADYVAPARGGRPARPVEQSGSGVYRISRPIIWSQARGRMTAAQATFIQTRPNTPVMVASGSQGEFNPPTLATEKQAAADDWSSVGLVFAYNEPSGERGFYWNTVGAIRTSGAAVGVFVPPGFRSALAAPAAAGETLIRVADAQTDPLGTHPWLPGLAVTLTLGGGQRHVARIVEVVGGTLRLDAPLPSGASAGQPVEVGQSTWHSNAVQLVRTHRHAHTHILVRGASTQNSFAQIYAYNDTAQTREPFNSIYGLYLGSINDVAIASLNLEWMTFTGAGLFVGAAQTCRIESLHTEGVRFGRDGLGLISFSALTMNIGGWVVDDLAVMKAQVPSAAGLIRPLHAAGRGYMRIEELSVKNGVVEGPLFLTLDSAQGRAMVDIDRYADGGDGGINLRRQMHSPEGQPIIGRLGGVLPAGCIGYSRKLLVKGGAGSRRAIYMGPPGPYVVNRVVVANAQAPMRGAAFRILDAGGARVADGAEGVTAAVARKTGQLSLSLDAGARRRTFQETDARLYYEIGVEPAAAPAVGVGPSGRRSFTARGAAYFLRTIQFSAPHGFSKGDEVIVSGAGGSGYNGQFELVAVTPNSITYYGYGGGPAERSVPDSGIVVQSAPVVDVFVFGDRLPT